MTLHNYLLFVFASILLVLMPGPDMVYMLARCIAQGRKAGVLAALGFNLGGFVHLTGAVLGLSAILASSSAAFTVVKWLGAAYLVYLGIGALRSRQANPAVAAAGALPGLSGKTILRQAFLSDMLNPKVALFFLAFVPQFVDAKGSHPTLQILLLGLTVNLISLSGNILLVYFCAGLTKTLRRNSSISVWLQKGMGALFIALGLRLAAEKS